MSNSRLDSMFNHESKWKYSARLADQLGDDQLIADFLLQFPEHKGNLAAFPSALADDRIVVFDENRNIVGTCHFMLLQRAGFMEENLIIRNFCAMSWVAGEALRRTAMRTSRELILEEIQIELVNPLGETMSSMYGDGYTFRSIGNARFVATLSKEKFIFPGNEQVWASLLSGEIPECEWEGKEPFHALMTSAL